MATAVDAAAIDAYLDAAPHLKHDVLFALYERLAREAVTLAAAGSRRPRALDLGAGEGTATRTLVAAGADVVAVDDDGARLETLRRRLPSVAVLEADALSTVRASPHEYDIVAAVSFLHHVPDYLALVDAALDALTTGGIFLSFQDPLAYASLGRPTRIFSRVAYIAWRIGRGELRGGAARYIRRRRSGYSSVLPEDLDEFHAQRGGVDHRAILRLLESRGVPVRLVLYFSTQSGAFHRVGTMLGLENTFAVIGGPVA